MLKHFALHAILLVLVLSTQLVVCHQLNGVDQLEANSTSSGSARFLSLFSVVRFSNSFCYGSNGLNGTCYTSAECTSLGGTASGSCASGFGVCCTICITTCGKSATVNNTYWGNPGYPSTYSTLGQCTIDIKKVSSNICQIRLDFIKFEIEGPDQGTTTASLRTQCQNDVFTVSGQSNNVPAICGKNTNQHMYLDMVPGSSQFTLNMLLSGTTSARTWKIRIAQIPCGTTYTAPDNCLQWFTTSVGTFSSFNYQYSATPLVQHLANQDYTICIRTNKGFCGICYAVCDSDGTVLPDAQKFRISDSVTPHTIDDTCITDWIQIPCATDQQSSSTAQTSTYVPANCVNKICGTYFVSYATPTVTKPVPVYSYRKPFEVRFYTDKSDALDSESIGFCLKYQQLPCTSG